MNPHRLTLTRQARDDITRNAAWWAEHHSLEQALRWHDDVYRQLEELRSSPYRFAVAPEDGAFPYELREMAVGGKRRTYRAIFTVTADEVLVLAVRRGAQDAFPAGE